MEDLGRYINTPLTSDKFSTVSGLIGANKDLTAGNYGQYKVTDTGRGTRIVSKRSPQEVQDEEIQRALARQREANAPAIDTLRQRDPLITQTFATERERLSGESASLKDRYAQLLEDVKGQGARREQRQTTATARELGKRGISSQSGLFDQELINAIDPISSETQSLTKNIGLEQESGLRNIRDLLASLTNQEASQKQQVAEAIANLQAGGAQTGIAQGLQSVRDLVADALNQEQMNLQRQQTQAAQAESAAQRALQQRIFNEISLPESQLNQENTRSLISNRGSSSGGGLLGNPYLSAIFGNMTGANTVNSSKLPTGAIGQRTDGSYIFGGFTAD